MKNLLFAASVLLFGAGPAAAGALSSFFESLSINVPALKSAAKTSMPEPAAPSAADQAKEYHTVRLCSYTYGQLPASPSVGLFAFDLDKDGAVCELPVFQGHLYGSYKCSGAGNTAAAAANGGTALLFASRTMQGSSLYHQLNVPADYKDLGNFRGKMRISGKPPADLSEPLQAGSGVYSLSCKMEKAAFPAD